MEPSGMMVWVSPPGKEPRLAGVLVEGDTKRIGEEGSYNYVLKPHDQLQK